MGYINTKFAFPSKAESAEKAVKRWLRPVQKYDIIPPFFILSHTVLRDPILGDIMRGKVELYLYLRTWIVRGKMYNDKLNLLTNYYKKGKLAAARPADDLAKDLHLGVKKVLCYLNAMEYYGIIEIEKIAPKDAFDHREHNVYIFGEHNQLKGKQNEEVYYIDIIL